PSLFVSARSKERSSGRSSSRSGAQSDRLEAQSDPSVALRLRPEQRATARSAERPPRAKSDRRRGAAFVARLRVGGDAAPLGERRQEGAWWGATPSGARRQ